MIFNLIIILATMCLITIIIIVIEAFYEVRKELNSRTITVKSKECLVCKNRHTMKCPNTSLCYCTFDRPYFEEDKERSDK